MATKAVKKISFGGLSLELRLDANSIIQIEKRLNESIMNSFMSPEGGFRLPPSNKLLIVLQGANQTHGVTDEDIVKAFGKFLDEGNTPIDLVTTVQELLDDSGFFSKKEDKKEKEESGKKIISLNSQPEQGTLD